ncbi:MAG: DUF2252 family protein [Lachnospiraceae bacterium]|nr:DUF2252 family protein [Lachnospiraceae bacterium]
MEEKRRNAVYRALESYHDAMARFSSRGTMDVWYSHLDVNQLLADHADKISGSTERMINKVAADAATKNSWRAVHKWTETVDGKSVIRSIPPILVPYRDLPEKQSPKKLEKFLKILMTEYRFSLPREVRKLIDQYRPVDIARKVVGVGSVGMRSYIMVLEGTAADDPLVLQFKEAGDSVLSPYVIVKNGVAKTGDRHAIAGYLGKSRKFEEAVTEFASHYADQNEEDYRTYVKYYKEQQEKRGESR